MSATRLGTMSARPRIVTSTAVKMGLRTQPNGPLVTSAVRSLLVDPDPPGRAQRHLRTEGGQDAQNRQDHAEHVNGRVLQHAHRR